ncbi:Predicted kinase, aminoglycoside phosphotransferase (APT) family [Amycolatopsis marina]|uniref:Predicted kinase, aminoglycoside phosphotransferase (APT) family n=2 Tax=Amycolatopsis marina TaxID=490629 RepID=A0A1I1C6C9_9PSEU|nr:Predicted kinase, aminoglycoside phosphotransferase (APT) family [Amycolatopsis marina]
MAEVSQFDDIAVDSVEHIERWMDRAGLGSGPLEDMTTIGGGTQNILLRFSRSGRGYVLRRPPAHKRRNSDETMLREAKVLAALAGSDVPHPDLIAVCGDLEVIGSAFYLMEPIDGFNPSVEIPDRYLADASTQRLLGFAVLDGLLALGRVRPAEVGLADLGRPDGWLERQVSRWQRQLAGYSESAAYSPDILPWVTEVGRWLAERGPRQHRMGLIHGDFHFANVLMDRDRPELAAIVDWELTTQGDPLLDFGHLLATWPQPENAAAVLPAVALPVLPSDQDLIEVYLRRSGRVYEDIVWFRVLACFRLAIILEGTYVRGLAGQTSRKTGMEAHQRAGALLDQAMNLLGKRA